MKGGKVVERVRYTVGEYDDDGTWYCILTDDCTDGFVIGDRIDADNLLVALMRLVINGQADEQIYQFDERLGHRWYSVWEAAKRCPSDVTQKVLIDAIQRGDIRYAIRAADGWRLSENELQVWLHRRHT